MQAPPQTPVNYGERQRVVNRQTYQNFDIQAGQDVTDTGNRYIQIGVGNRIYDRAEDDDDDGRRGGIIKRIIGRR